MRTLDSCFIHGDHIEAICPKCDPSAGLQSSPVISVNRCADCGKLVIAIDDRRIKTKGTEGHGGGKCSGRWTEVANAKVS